MKHASTLFSLAAVVCSLSFAAIPGARAAQIDINGPPGSGAFGTNVIVLPNGNFVVTDPGYDAPGPIANVGAVYLYDGVTLALISTLTGSTASDRVGNAGVTVLSNSNYVVSSRLWNGSRGAVTWGSGTNGVKGAVSALNSLVGSTANDQLGYLGVTALNNGNYVVSSPFWDYAGWVDAGAVTWSSGTNGVKGVVSSANSLVGSRNNDSVGGYGVTALNNGNYVVGSFYGSQGAVTWGSGTAGLKGVISSANSLVGSRNNDHVGFGQHFPKGVTALNNGDYVVRSPDYDNSVHSPLPEFHRYDGAVTLGDGTLLGLGHSGAVTAGNSVLGYSNTGSSMYFAYDYLNTRLLVGDPSSNRVSLFIHPPIIVIALVPEGVRLRFRGVPGRSYTIERAPTVTGPWSTLNTQTVPPSELLQLIEYIDTTPPPGQAFYRVVASS